MKKRLIMVYLFICCFSCFNPIVFAHVPYLEHRDFTVQKPFHVKKSIAQSIAVYAWLQTNGTGPSTDIDVYTFSIKNPQRVHLEVLVPVANGYYSNFTPWFALVGPGLPPANQTVPFDIPQGCGVIVKKDVTPGTPRKEFYEPFGGKSYYQGPGFDETINVSGMYHVYYRDPYQRGGDYVAVLGYKE